MLDFARTPIGKRFFESSIPDLIQSINKLTDAVEKSNLLQATANKHNDAQLQLERRRLITEEKNKV